MVVLETDRLVLRTFRESDLDGLEALYRDPEVRRYVPDCPADRAATREELMWFVAGGNPARPGTGLWATIHKATGAFIGRCGLIPWTIEGREEVEVAYMIDRRFWRQGLGAEVVRALIRHGFERLGLSRVIAVIEPGNVASIRTAERAGLAFERVANVEGLHCPVYAIAGPQA
jgi:ribosomal-protein-alanine N-acetyltransferase